MRLLATLAFSFLLTSILIVGLLAAGCTERPTEEPVPPKPAISGLSSATPTPTQTPDSDNVAPGSEAFELELVIDPPGAGFVVAIPPFGPYAPGTTVTLGVIRPRVPPYIFSRWTGDGSGSERAVHVVMDGPKRVVARFINPYITPTPSPEEK